MSESLHRRLREGATLLGMSRSPRTAWHLGRGWLRVQLERPAERPDRRLRLVVSLAGRRRALTVRDTQSDTICMLDILVRDAYGRAIALGRRHRARVAYDIGANIGIASALLRTRLDCQVIAFEPGISELDCLQRNADERVLVLPVALTNGDVALHQFRASSAASGGQHLAATPTEAEERFAFRTRAVLGASLAVWHRQLGLPEPDLVKIDAEGAESLIVADLLAAGLRPQVVVVETHGAERLRETRSAMSAAGYRLVDEQHGRRATAILTYERDHASTWVRVRR